MQNNKKISTNKGSVHYLRVIKTKLNFDSCRRMSIDLFMGDTGICTFSYPRFKQYSESNLVDLRLRKFWNYRNRLNGMSFCQYKNKTGFNNCRLHTIYLYIYLKAMRKLNCDWLFFDMSIKRNKAFVFSFVKWGMQDWY